MMTIGLTGGIGMGKSTTAAYFAELGLPVWDADGAVHRLYAAGGAGVGPVLDRFPDTGSNEAGIDRGLLSEQVVGNPAALKDLENIVHPLVAADRRSFLVQHQEAGTKAVVLDIPLLFETESTDHFDLIVVCSAPEEIRKARVMKRPGMTEEKYIAITSRQTPDDEKCARADYVVPTGGSFDDSRAAVEKIVAEVRTRGLDAGPEQVEK